MITTHLSYRLWLFGCALWLTVSPAAAKGRYNITFAQLDTCQNYDITKAGYAYKEFFMVHSLDNNKIKANEHLHLKFYVLTNMDAHILLSVTDRPRPNDRVYEIVIGAGGNTFSTIRTYMGSRRVSTNQDPRLLSMYDPTPIEIVQTKDGEVQVLIPGFKTAPLLHFLDPSPLTINYISFSTFNDNSASWFYDCEFDGFATEMEKEERELSADQQIFNALLFQAENASQPINLRGINFGFQVRALAYESANALLRTRIQLTLNWQDARLQWMPENYANITSVVLPHLQIWTPHIVVLNGALDTLLDALKSYEMRVYANGNVSLLASNLELTTWCVDTARNWPDERLDCDIELGIEQGIPLFHDHGQPLANEHVNTLTAWTFAQIGVSHVENGTQTRYTHQGMLQTMTGDVAIEFTLLRNSTFYRHVFVMPLIACQIFIVLSFLLRGYRRGALILVVLLLTALGLMYITKHATPHYVPPLMLAYQHIMRIATFGYALHIAIMWLEQHPPRGAPASLLSLINLAPLRLLLGLRFADASEYCKIQEKPWGELAKMCNSLGFVAIIGCFAAINVIQLSGV